MCQAIMAFTVSLLFIALPSAVDAAFVERTCHGNIETYDRKIIQAGVIYDLSYEVSDKKVKVRFAGREFDAEASVDPSEKVYKGLWITKIVGGPDSFYFSFLPKDGGTIKFEFAPDRWYSGNCL